MKYLPFILLCLLGLTTTKTQSASSTSTPIPIPKAVVYASDSLVVKDPKKQKRARVIWVLSAGAVLTIGGIVLGIPQMIIIGGIFIIIALLSAQKKPQKKPQKTPQSKPSNSSTEGVASPGCAVAAVVGGVAVAGILLYLLLNYGYGQY